MIRLEVYPAVTLLLQITGGFERSRSLAMLIATENHTLYGHARGKADE
jgi:hypothetical protein